MVVKAKPGKQALTVAKGTATTTKAGEPAVPLTLTRLGKALVKKAGKKGLRVSLTATGTLTGQRPATKTLSPLRLRG